MCYNGCNNRFNVQSDFALEVWVSIYGFYGYIFMSHKWPFYSVFLRVVRFYTLVLLSFLCD